MIKQKTAFVLVGIPASGKSTLSMQWKKHLNALDRQWYYYSSDTYIEDIAEKLHKTYSEVFEEYFKEAREYCDKLLPIAFRAEADIIWDQTNLGIKKRAHIIRMMKQKGYRVEALAIRYDGDRDFLQSRIDGRPGKDIPSHVIDDMIKRYVEPTIEEGFDKVTMYSMDGNIL